MKLSLMNLKSQSDIGQINEFINVMDKLIQKDISTSLKKGKLVYRKSSEIQSLFNKTSFPRKWQA